MRNQEANVKSINIVANTLSETKLKIDKKNIGNHLNLRRKFLVVKQGNN